MATGITEFAAGFEYVESERSVTCTRVYNYDPDDPDDHGVEVPTPGDDLDGTTIPIPLKPAGVQFSGCICRSRSWKAIAGDSRKTRWIVEFNNEPVDINIFNKPEDPYSPLDFTGMPISLEFGGEMVTINPGTNPAASEWTWRSDGTSVLQPVSKKVKAMTLRISRYVKDGEDFKTFNTNVHSLLGRVNDRDNPFGENIGGGTGCWFFAACPTEILHNYRTDRWWKADMEFGYRDPDYTNLEGWQKILRLDGSWDVPLNKAGAYMYLTGDFSKLWNNSSYT
jgi:hypothetical protein